jgi:hypothetical protein
VCDVRVCGALSIYLKGGEEEEKKKIYVGHM